MQPFRQLRPLWPAAVLVALLIMAGVVLAAAPPAQDGPAVQIEGATSAVALGTAFSFQGQIADENGGVIEGQCDLKFELYDAATGGTKLGEDVKPNQPLSGGLFATQLDFGSGAFRGDARWVDLSVRCPSGAGAYELLPLRHELSAVPYALSLRPGARIEGAVPSGLTYEAGLRVTNSSPTYPIALYGITNAPSGPAIGVAGNNSSPNGFAVYGYSSPKGTGVRGEAPQGAGVWGSSVDWIGTYGYSKNSIGVMGESPASTGVYGKSVKGRGVSGESVDEHGVFGSSTNGAGVAGISTNYNGVRGVTGSSTSSAVSAENTGSGPGIFATSKSGPAAVFNGLTRTFVLQITGGSDLAERFEVSDNATAEPGTVMSIDPANPGHLTASSEAYDRKVAGVVSGAGDVATGLVLHQEGVLEGDTVVAIAGRVYVRADATSGPIVPGDLLTTSDRPGYAMAARDDSRSHGAVIGKAMTGLESGTGLVLVLINLQ
jgi:hypothetical protein